MSASSFQPFYDGSPNLGDKHCKYVFPDELHGVPFSDKKWSNVVNEKVINANGTRSDTGKAQYSKKIKIFTFL